MKYLAIGIVVLFLTIVGIELYHYNMPAFAQSEPTLPTETVSPPPFSHPVVLLTVPDSAALASAVHIGNGYFLTANHTLLNRTQVNLLPQEFDEPVMANVMWVSASYDVAYLYAPELSHISHYPLTCEELQMGQELVFHGNPAGLSSISTWGRVAGKPFNPDTPFWELVLPVNAAIVPGMSGGSATVNDELVGINVGTHVYNLGFSGSFTNISYIVPNTVLCQLLFR